jgi:hypothetical protein
MGNVFRLVWDKLLRVKQQFMLVYLIACTTINKVCASGMKSVMMAQAIQCGDAEIVVWWDGKHEFSSALYAFENWNQIWSNLYG